MPVSSSDAEPYRDEDIRTIVPGETSRQDVVDRLGDADSTYDDGRWSVYRTDRHMGEWLVFAGMGAGSFGGDSVEYRLVIGFDAEDRVRSVSVVDEAEPCNEAGTVCLDSYGMLQLAASIETRPVAGIDECVVFLYTLKPASPDSVVSVEIDDAQRYQVWRDETYRRLVLEPGEHRLEALGHLPGYFYERADFACEGGGSAYFLVQHDDDWVPRLIQRTTTLGESDIDARRTVVPPDADADTGIDAGVPTWTFAETVAPHEEVARVTSDLISSNSALFALDNILFETRKDDLIVAPGCRCICLGYVSGVHAQATPVCFDARAEHTYTVSVGTEFHRNVWVNEWPNSEVGDRLDDEWSAAFNPLNGRKNRLFKYRYRADGSWYPRDGDPESPYCKPLPEDCMQVAQDFARAEMADASPSTEP